MPRKARAQRFLVEPLAVTRDPAFEAMSHEARGVYLTILLEAWFEREPGVIRYTPDKLARMGQCSVEKWADLRPEIEPAFHVQAEAESVTLSRCDTSGQSCVTWWTLPLMGGAYVSQNARRDKDRKRQQARRQRERDIRADKNTTSLGGSGSGSGTGTENQTDGRRAREPDRQPGPDRPRPGDPTPGDGLVAALVSSLKHPATPTAKVTP